MHGAKSPELVEAEETGPGARAEHKRKFVAGLVIQSDFEQGSRASAAPNQHNRLVPKPRQGLTVGPPQKQLRSHLQFPELLGENPDRPYDHGTFRRREYREGLLPHFRQHDEEELAGK